MEGLVGPIQTIWRNAQEGGIVDRIVAEEGAMLHAGDTILVLEAMKMQNNIEAENDGEITSVMVKIGDSVMEGSLLVTIA